MQGKDVAFYHREYQGDQYANHLVSADHPFYPSLKSFIETFQLTNKRSLEIGCGRGAFQNLVSEYYGVDLAFSAGKYFYKPFVQASAAQLPFADASFDAVWSYAVLEHVIHPETALLEMRRVIKNGGYLLLAPAWQCRPWLAEGYPVRPYSDFPLKGKFIKASIPVRDSVLWRSFSVFPTRLFRTWVHWITRRPLHFQYRPLKPNFDYFWMPDSDAVNSMDPYEALLWFHSRGDECVNYPGWIKKFFVKHGGLIIKIIKQ
jgi:SAM-dependent methyltransferase